MSFGVKGNTPKNRRVVEGADKSFAKKGDKAHLEGRKGSTPTVNTKRNKELHFGSKTNY